jgi:hypothetical protein
MKHNNLSGLMDRFLISAGQMAFVEEAGGTAAFLQQLHKMHRYLSSSTTVAHLFQETATIADALQLYRCSVNTLNFQIYDDYVARDHEVKRGDIFYWVIEQLEIYLENGGTDPQISLQPVSESGGKVKIFLHIEGKNDTNVCSMDRSL